jgi:hypothetical protein
MLSVVMLGVVMRNVVAPLIEVGLELSTLGSRVECSTCANGHSQALARLRFSAYVPG